MDKDWSCIDLVVVRRCEFFDSAPFALRILVQLCIINSLITLRVPGIVRVPGTSI
jgi:hypothetical protein